MVILSQKERVRKDPLLRRHPESHMSVEHHLPPGLHVQIKTRLSGHALKRRTYTKNVALNLQIRVKEHKDV